MWWYRLDSIEVLPAYASDLVDEDYLCPVVVYTKKMLAEKGWGPKQDDEVYDDVNIRTHDHESPKKYRDRYGNRSFYVTVDEDKVDVDVCIKAVKRLNEVLRLRDEDFRFEYDQNMIKEDDIN